MPTTITILTPTAAPVEPTPAQQTAKQLLADSDLALNRLAVSVQRGFELLWGTKDDPRDIVEAQAAYDELGANAAPLFARHAAMVAFLATEGLATFEPWELTPAYAIDANGILGDLSPAWTTEIPPAE